MIKQTLNTNKNELTFSHPKILVWDSFLIETSFSQQKQCCRYLAIQIDRNPSFVDQLNKTLKKISPCCTILSSYLITHQILLKTRVHFSFFQSLVLLRLSLLTVLFQNLSDRTWNSLINSTCGINVCFLHKKFDRARDLLMQTTIPTSELFSAKMSLINFHYNTVKSDDFKNSHWYLSLPQNAPKNHSKLYKMLKLLLERIQ